MKLKCVFFILFIAFTTMAMKAGNLPIPVSVNESITVTLFFPSEIKKVIEPAPNYKLEYDRNGKMATLVARKGAASNLTVITKNGYIFSFLLQYETEVDNFTYVLAEDQAIGKLNGSSVVELSGTNGDVTIQDEKPVDQEPIVQIEVTTSETSGSKENNDTDKEVGAELGPSAMATEETPENAGSSLYDSDREGYYRIFCENSYLQKSKFKKISNTVNLIGLQLNNIIKDHNDLHFVLEVKNNSWSDYKVKSLRFFIKSLEGSREIQVKDLFIYNLQESIAAHNSNHLVFVCKEFVLGEGQNIYVLLEEDGGRERSVMLSLTSQQIKHSR
ncbi:DUF4138 domain-containing protein [Pseudozobellia thermophila]|uniref:Bacteroides conjugative transposon TraN protein n=1 Tax=Pseudozobellia thermophila TaxID=192903 RepID=A0A1M6M1G0_9FLAO|nr:DUF4138 domain-containing protein [Pseudozobellia thermophila]SHJ77294.1 protein of unknown function [Pseudozobellia thermophila]